MSRKDNNCHSELVSESQKINPESSSGLLDPETRFRVTNKKLLQDPLSFLKAILSEFKEKTIWFFNIIKSDVVLLCISSLFFISLCWIIFLGYLFPSYTWDALWYHLPIVGYIVQSGVIQENPTPSMIDLFINIFPKNIELFFVWNTIFLNSSACLAFCFILS